MSKTQRFRDQHDELLEIAGQIAPHLKAEALKDASKVRSLLSQLLGKLNIHLAMEDKSLYPALVEHSDSKIKATAQQFMDEMGGIKEVVVAYSKKWPTASSIEDSPQDFITETEGIFAALGKRIESENGILYPMLDAS